MTIHLTESPIRGTWATLDQPQEFFFAGLGEEPVRLHGHYIGRVEQHGTRLRMYDLNGALKADIGRSAKFWAAAPYHV